MVPVATLVLNIIVVISQLRQHWTYDNLNTLILQCNKTIY